MPRTVSNLLERLGVRKAEVEGPLYHWDPDSSRLITGYKKVKKKLARKPKPSPGE